MAFDLSRAAAAQLEGKALPAHPAFMQPGPVSVYSPGKPREDAVISQREASRHSEAYGGGRAAIDHVYDAINLYSDPISTAEYRLERNDGTKLVRVKTKLTPPDHEVGPAELYKLLDKPNPFMLYDELMALLVIDLLLVGNAYWFKWNWGTPAAALYRLAPSATKIKPGQYGPKKYIYQPKGVRKPLEIDPEKILHFRRPNPHSEFYGMGVIQGGGRAMDLDMALTDTMAAYYENKADPSLIVQSERRVPRDVFNKLRAQLRARTAGPSNAGELLVLEAGLKASTLDRSARDSLFHELGKMSRDRVYTKFRASPLLFGLLDQATGSNKVSDARREFDNSTLKPVMTKVGRMITAGVTTDWDVKFAIDHESVLPPEDAIKVAESVSKAPGMKVRDVRRAYRQFGYEESTGDPEIDEMVLNLPGEEMDEDGQGVDGGPGLADMPTGGEPGRPPLRQNTAPIRRGSGSQASARVRSPRGKSLEEAMAALEAAGKAVSTPAPDNRLPGEQRPDDNFASARKVDIDSTTLWLTAELRDAAVELERGLLDTVEGKALKTSDIVQRVKTSKAWETFKQRVEAALEEGARRAAISGVMHSGMTPEEDIDYDAIVKSVVHRPDGLRSILATIKSRVARQVREVRDGDGERSDYEAGIRLALSTWSNNQTVAIADSEATEAYNEGTITAAEMSGVTKFFVVEEDDAPDEACQEAAGQVWDADTARARRKEHPRCRRAFLPLTVPQVA